MKKFNFTLKKMGTYNVVNNNITDTKEFINSFANFLKYDPEFVEAKTQTIKGFYSTNNINAIRRNLWNNVSYNLEAQSVYFEDDKLQAKQHLSNLKKDIETLRYTPFTYENKDTLIGKQIEYSSLKRMINNNYPDILTSDGVIYPLSATLIDTKFMPDNSPKDYKTHSLKTTTNNILFSDLRTILCTPSYAGKHLPSLGYYAYKKDLFRNLSAPHICINDMNIRSTPKINDSNITDYTVWNGLSIVDIDLKQDKEFNKLTDDEKKTRTLELIECFKRDIGLEPWVFAIKPSNSDKGIHIYTKVRKPNHVINKTEVQENSKLFAGHFLLNYFHKHAIVGYLLKQYGVDIEDESNGSILDLSTVSLAQLINIAPKTNTYINKSFKDLSYQFTLSDSIKCNGVEVPFNEYFTDDEFIMGKLIKSLTSLYSTELFKGSHVGVSKAKNKRDSKITIKGGNVNNKPSFEVSKLPKGEKHDLRWKTCNTIAYYVEDTEEAKELCYHLLDADIELNHNEIDAFINVAKSSHKKPNGAIKAKLESLGYRFSLKDGVTKEEVRKDTINIVKETFEVSNKSYTIFDRVNNNNTINHNVTLNKGEYLSDKKDQLINAFTESKINYIESFAGTGKTHLFKELSKDNKVCLILPFTSIIDSKIESDPTFKDTFKIYKDNINTKDVDGSFNVCMTFDKFSKLSYDVIKFFDYVVIDEAHLIFNSKYRDVMCSDMMDVLKKITHEKNEDFGFRNITSLEDDFLPTFNDYTSKNYIVLMSGTPSEEINYFSNRKELNHIKINNEIKQDKHANVILCPDRESRDNHFVNKLLYNIENDIKNIVITNKGENYTVPLTRMLNNKLSRELVTEYFKVSNKDNDVNNEIMYDSRLSEKVDILFASSYLSVGVDIENTNKFNVFFPYNEHTAEDIEQFNNRLRKTDIDCYIYEIVLDEKGEEKDYEKEFNTLYYTPVELTPEQILNDEKIKKQIEDDNIFRINASYHKGNDFKSVIRSESLIELYRYSNKAKAKKNMLYICNQLEDKYKYRVEKIDSIDQDNAISNNIKNEKVLYNKEQRNLIKDFVMSIQYVDCSGIKQQNIVLNDNVDDAVLIDGVLNINSVFKGVYKDVYNNALVLKHYYSPNTISNILERHNTKAGLSKYIELVKLRDIDGKQKGVDKVVNDKLMDAICDTNYIEFKPSDDLITPDEMSNKEVSKLSNALRDKYIESIAVEVSNAMCLTNETVTRKKVLSSVKTLFNSLFTSKKTDGVLRYTLRPIFEFDSETFENDDNIGDTLGSGDVTKKELTDKMIIVPSKKVTKRQRERIMKRLIKAYLKDNGSFNPKNFIDDVKDVFMEQTNTELTRKIFDTEYKDVYKKSKNQIIGVK